MTLDPVTLAVVAYHTVRRWLFPPPGPSDPGRPAPPPAS